MTVPLDVGAPAGVLDVEVAEVPCVRNELRYGHCRVERKTSMMAFGGAFGFSAVACAPERYRQRRKSHWVPRR